MDILFWSGGKDAYLALEFYRRKYPGHELKLLTTYSSKNEMVPHQKIPIDHIKCQAEALNLELITLPLPEECPNDLYIGKVNEVLRNQDEEIEYLIFGDWYLQDIRDWREQQFNSLGYTCLFPIWEKSIHTLLPVLLLKPVEVRISAIADEFTNYLRVGEIYNQQLVQQLPKEIDPMGEKGEFHTKIIFKEWENEQKQHL